MGRWVPTLRSEYGEKGRNAFLRKILFLWGVYVYFLRRVDVILPRRVDIVIDPLCFFSEFGTKKRRLLFDRFERGATRKVEILVVLGCVDEAPFLSFFFLCWAVVP